jgi:hypothetical protein
MNPFGIDKLDYGNRDDWLTEADVETVKSGLEG